MQSLFFLTRPDLGSWPWTIWRGYADAPIPTEPDASHKESSQPHQWHEEQEAAEAEAQRDNKEHQCGITRGSALAPPREQADDQEEPQPASALMTRRAT
jgi:hypothetical protein